MNHPRTLGPIARRLALRGLVALALFAGSEEHTSELQSPYDLVCRLLLEKKKNRCFYLDSHRFGKNRALGIGGQSSRALSITGRECICRIFRHRLSNPDGERSPAAPLPLR